MMAPHESKAWIRQKLPYYAKIRGRRSTPYTAAKSVCDSIAKYHTNLLLNLSVIV